MDLTRRLLPVDRLVAVYNVALAGIWIWFLGRTPVAPWMVVAHLAALGIVALLARAPARLAEPARTLRELYPMLWFLAFWGELDVLHQLWQVPFFDSAIRALDLRLFGLHGTHLNLYWMPRMPQIWLSEPMHFFYFAYYALIALPPIAALVTGRTDAVRDIVFRFMLTYLSCFLIYTVFPVLGPGLTLPHYQGALTSGLFYRLARGALGLGDSPGCAFPSSHVAGAVTIAYVGWRWFPRRFGVLMVIEAVGVLISTVYTQNHYPIDALSGCAWGLALQIFVAPALAARLSRGVTVPAPILPRFAEGPARSAAL